MKDKIESQQQKAGTLRCNGKMVSPHETLKEIKEPHPLKVVVYSEAKRLIHEPAFVWWTKCTLKK